MIPYPIHVAILLAVCLLFYKLLLQNQTYYKLNRWILLACLLLAFILPMVQIPQAISFRSAQPAQGNIVATPANPVKDLAKATIAISVDVNEIAHQTTQSAQSPAPVVQLNTPPQLNKASALKWAMWLYWAGCVAFAANFLLQIIVLFYQAYKKPVIRDGSYRIVEIGEDKAPCSFGNNIFINPTKYDWETYQQILLHEKVHIQQRHTLDLILAELMLILQWFNPFAWYYRNEIENNLEFLTDDSIISQHKVAAEAYQLSLLKVSVPNFAMHITTNYNQSLLKRRILMMNAKQSNIHTSWKYFMLVPVLAVLVCGLNQQAASSSPLAKNKAVKTINQPQGKTGPAETVALPATASKQHAVPAHLRDAKLEMLYNELRRATITLGPIFNNPKLGDPSIKPDMQLLEDKLAKANPMYSAEVLKAAASVAELQGYPNLQKAYAAWGIAFQNLATYVFTKNYLAKLQKMSADDKQQYKLYVAQLEKGLTYNKPLQAEKTAIADADTDMADALSAKPADLNLTTFIQDNAELIKHGEFKKVLERHIWYHNHALEYNPGLTGVRLSFALSDWKKLADMYPPALRAMQKIRDNKTKEVARNASSDLFMDVAALNRTLGEDGKTVDLFKTLDAKQPEVAAACFQQAKPALFAANQYGTIRKYLGDPVKAFDNILKMYNTMGSLSSIAVPNESANFKALRDSTLHKVIANKLITESMQLIQYAVAINDMKSAKEIQKKALALVKDDRLNHALDH